MSQTAAATRLSPLTRPSGAFAMLAVDQREALRNMLAAQREGPVTDAEVTDFKLRATATLTPFASAVLLDKQFVLDRAIEEGAVDPRCALIAGADEFVPGPGEVVADVRIDPAVDPGHYRSAGAAALKLLVVWRPDEGPQRRVAMVEEFVALAHGADLAAIIEPVTRPRATAPPPTARRTSWPRPASSGRSAQTCTRPRSPSTAAGRRSRCAPPARR